jgi:hypothetical protein
MLTLQRTRSEARLTPCRHRCARRLGSRVLAGFDANNHPRSAFCQPLEWASS